MGKKLDIELINDLCECDKERYCTLKELLKIAPTFEPRFIVQLKCVEIFKYEAGTRFHTDIGWSEAMNEWVESGYAAVFADVYSEAMEKKEKVSCKTLYSRIIERSKKLEIH